MRSRSPPVTSVSPARRRLRFGRLLLEDVVRIGLAAHDLAGAGDLEALGGAPVGLHLGHVVRPCWSAVGWALVDARASGCERRPRRGLGARLGFGRRCARRRRLGRRSARRARWCSVSVGLGRRCRCGVGGSARRRARPRRGLGFALRRARGGLGPLVGGEHHGHVAAVELGDRPRPGRRRRRLSATWSRILLAQLGVVHLPATEHDRDLDLVALAEELLDLAGLGVEVAAADLGPVLHLLDRRRWCSCGGFLGLLRGLVLELAVVHDPTDRRVGLVGHLDQVEVELPGDGQGLGQRLDADLLRRRGRPVGPRGPGSDR